MSNDEDFMKRTNAVVELYERTFDSPFLHPMYIPEERVVAVHEQAIKNGKPTPYDYDWYSGLPDDACA